MREHATSSSQPVDYTTFEFDLRVDQVCGLPDSFEETFKAVGPQYGLSSALQVAKYMLFNPMPGLIFDVKGSPNRMTRWMPSTRIGDGVAGPWQHYNVVVVGKMPGQEEIMYNQSMCGPSGQLLLNMAYEVGIGDQIRDAYGTNVVRFVPPDGGKSLKPQHKKACQYLLMQELCATKPDFILCLGTDAVKAVYGKKYTMTKVRSHVFVLDSLYDLGANKIRDANDVTPLEYESGTKLFATIHPAAVLREEGLRAGFRADMAKFKPLVLGTAAGNVEPGKGCDYRYIDDVDRLKSLVDEILATGIKRVALDCEWGGGDFRSGKLRTVQLSWGERKAACIIYRKQHLKNAVTPATMYLFDQELKRLLLSDGMKVIGHNLRADALWMNNKGIDIISRAYMDTMLVDHALSENAEHKLESCAVRYTDMGRYDWALKQWLQDQGIGEKRIKKDGYSMIPDHLLHPYGCCDVDATWRICEVFRKVLAADVNADARRCYEEVIHPCMNPLHEIENNGMLVDRELMEKLVFRYEQKKIELVEKLRDDIDKPSFNYRSPPQVVKLLYGKEADGGLGLTPLKTTEKPARMWEDVLALSPIEFARVNPSTDAESLEYLGIESDVASLVRDIRIIDQVTKNFLRSPEQDLVSGLDTYVDGLVGQIDDDGRVRTSMNQMSETGRQKSSNPNLQNLPNRQNDELDRIMGKATEHIRSCFIASPGCVLIESDYQSAELFTLGFLSNCPALVRDAGADLHGRGAVTRMGAPKWDGFDDYKKPPPEWKEEFKHLRIASKTISFGIPYQRGAKAIAREIVKTTKGLVACDVGRAQEMVDGFYTEYPEVHSYVEMCKDSVLRGSLFQPYGRTRRFVSSEDQGHIAAQQREAVNFPIQGTVADTLNVAMYNLWCWRQFNPGLASYRILLAVHDAVILEVPINSVRTVVERVLPECLKFGAVIPSWKPTPEYVPTTAFSLDIDTDVTLRWGEKPDKEELLTMGLSEDLVKDYAA